MSKYFDWATEDAYFGPGQTKLIRLQVDHMVIRGKKFTSFELDVYKRRLIVDLRGHWFLSLAKQAS